MTFEKSSGDLEYPGIEVVEASWYCSHLVVVQKNVDFIDAYNVAWLMAQGLDVISTFDRKHFSRLEGVKVWTRERLCRR